LAKRYGWTIEYILGLTRRQIRLLTLSAGDAERLPDDDNDASQSDDITDNKEPVDLTVKQKHLDKLRKGLKLKSKSHIVDNLVGKSVAPVYKKPTNPIKSRHSPDKPSSDITIKDLIRMGQGNEGPFSLGDKLQNKLKKR